MAIKKGSEVRFKIDGGETRKGEVIGVVQPGVMPDFSSKAFKDLKKSGLYNTKPREERSFLVKGNGRLYWPKVKTIQEV